MLATAVSFYRATTGAMQKVEGACKPIRTAQFVLGIPGQMRDAVTRPLAGKMVGYWCSGQKHERACLKQAYGYADRAIRMAADLTKKGSQAAGMPPQQWEKVEELAGLIGEVRDGVDMIGCAAGSLGTGLKWIGTQMGNASNAIFQRGQSLGQSQSSAAKVAGKALAGMSYVPWAFSYAPAAMGHVLEMGGNKTHETMRAANLRKRVAEEVFLPLILKGNLVVKQQIVQGGLNVCANSGYWYAMGLFDMQNWAALGSSAVSVGSKAVFAAQAAVGGWIWAPTVKSGADLLRATCTRKAQVEKLKQELLRVNPSLSERWRFIPGGAEFLLGLFLESHSFLLSYYTNRPEEFIQAFCDWSGVMADAGSIAINVAGERN